MKPSCDTCKFWERKQQGKLNNEEECRRNAPLPFTSHVKKTINALGYIMWASYVGAWIDEDTSRNDQDEVAATTDHSWAFWPITMDADWCGEHTPST